MGKTRDPFRKTGNIKGTFHPKMGTIKDKNGRNPVDTEEIKKGWKEYMEELYKKDINEPDYYDGVVSHPEPDILECEVKWTLRSTADNKASGCDEIPTELFRSLKNDAIKVSKSGRHSSGHRPGKGQSSSQYPRKVSHPVMSSSLRYHEPQPTPLLCPWNFPGKGTGVDCHFVLWGISPTWGLNWGLLHCRQILYKLTHQGSDPQEG